VAAPNAPSPRRRWDLAPPKREPLTRDRIVRAAMAVVDSDGLDALSMRRVAADLGTGAASLYAHVANKEELLQLLVNLATCGTPIPDPDPARWQEQIKDVVRGIRSGLGAHRDLARACLGRIPTGAEAMVSVERILAILVAAGLPRQVIAYSVDILALYATATAYEESVYLAREAGDVEGYLEDVTSYFRGLPPDQFPHTAGLAAELTRCEGDERFEFGLDALVRGIAAMRSD
jgi:AcrR family transcriptional regulator